MAKPEIRIKARLLRQQGFGIKTIAHKLNVSSSTVSLWCKDINLTSMQIKELERRSHDPYYGQRLKYLHKIQQAKQKNILKYFNSGIKDIGSLSEKELFTAGVSLYWAEGFKSDNQVGFANSDPNMIKFFIFWLKKCCDIEAERLKIRLGLNIQYQSKTTEIQQYWVNLLNIPLSQFQKTYYQKVKWKKTYDHPENYHGVLRIRVSKSSQLLRSIYGWIEGLKRNIQSK